VDKVGIVIEVISCLGRKDAYIVLKISKKLGKARYSDIEKELIKEGYYVTSPTLTARLRDFQSTGILKKIYDEESDEIYYTLTTFGNELVDALLELEDKYNKHVKKKEISSKRIDRVVDNFLDNEVDN